MLIAPQFLLFSFIIFCAILLYRHIKLRSQLVNVPSPRSWMLFGHVLIIKPDMEGFIDQLMGMAQLYPQHPRMTLFWFGTIPTLMIYSARLVESLFSNNNHINKGMFYDMFRPWLGNGLLTNTGEGWRARRKLLTPTFHHEILKSFVNVFNYQADILVRKLHTLVGKTEGQIDDITPLISLCTLDIICETSMGRSVNAQQEEDSDYVKAVLCINDIIQNRQKNPLVWPDLFFWYFGAGRKHEWSLNILKSFTRKVIIERKVERKLQRINQEINIERRLAFLDLLLKMEENGDLSENDVQEEVDTFMFEGHDTTAAAITWSLFMLGCHLEYQQKCYEEIQSVCGDSDNLSFETLGKLCFLECFIKESLRLYPSVPLITRRLNSDAEIGGHVFPADTQIVINIYQIHRDPEHWDDAEKFMPERFLTDNIKDRHPFAFVPFSAGSRNCIGQRFALLEEKTVLGWILRNFHVKSLLRRDQLRTKAELILRQAKPVKMLLTPRTKKETNNN
uniref:Uncharacterized protein n=1 Tax=Meloidogyne enterolobii TaxID=390850 RepID=A0A6V7Y4B6_MELEN|nr:unnamed protein product [Meloidogyne enterolobii]